MSLNVCQRDRIRKELIHVYIYLKKARSRDGLDDQEYQLAIAHMKGVMSALEEPDCPIQAICVVRLGRWARRLIKRR